MPSAPAKPCRTPLCAGRVPGGGYCPECQRARDKAYSRKRQTDPEIAGRFYRTAAWRRLRAWFLRQHPFCAMCEADGCIITAASIVDHIEPIRQGGAALDARNLQSLCGPCHSGKTAIEGSRWGGGVSFLGRSPGEAGTWR